MTREWKPGDVARMPDGEAAVVDTSMRFVYGHGEFDNAYPGSANGLSARPLVVIDPEDREQVERLMETYRAQPGWFAGNKRQTEDCMQAALREFANPTPPKPDEPQGLGAVVEDAEGRKWIYIATQKVAIRCWRMVNHDTWRDYADIAAIRVLSEGVQP